MTGGRCYIIGAGDRTDDRVSPETDDLVIAADGGLVWLRDMGVEPHLVVGDFDSLTAAPEGLPTLRLAKEKDDTDTMAAIAVGIERGYKTFHIYGGTGGRFDHTQANLQLLTYLSRRGYEGVLHGRDWQATAVTDGALCLPARPSGMISVFCQGDTATGVCLEGLKYPLRNATLTCDFPLGVSNEFTGVPVRVVVEKGTLLVICERE